MGKGNVLNTWIKEFCTLVFTQTIQAFIYAIVLVIILVGMRGTSIEVSNDDHNASLGLMAVFALISVFKVEEIVRKIFGIGSTPADPKSAIRSIAKTAFAAQIGKKVLNNVGKVTGGVGAIAKSRRDNLEAKNNLKEDMDNLGIGPGGTGGAGAGGAGATGTGNDAGRGTGGGMDSKTREKYTKIMRDYKKQASEIKKARNEGIKSIISGGTESVGALIGGTAGGIFGIADGNLDEGVQGLMAGAGIGDMVGGSIVSATDKAIDTIRTAAKHEGISSKKLKEAIKAYAADVSDT